MVLARRTLLSSMLSPPASIESIVGTPEVGHVDYLEGVTPTSCCPLASLELEALRLRSTLKLPSAVSSDPSPDPIGYL